MNPILIVGDIMLDRYIIGNVERISPEAPVPVVRVRTEELRIGGAGNVALNVVKQGCLGTLLGFIGADHNGLLLKNLLFQHDIDFRFVEIQLPTICKTRVVGNMQQIVRFDFEELGLIQFPLDKIRRHLDYFNFGVVVISDYKKGVCSAELCKMVIDTAYNHQAKVIVDPKGTDWNRYTGAYLVTPNVKELGEIVGKPIENDDSQIVSLGSHVKAKYQLQNLLITRSEKGMTLISNEGIEHIQTSAKGVFDVTGAGDTVVATIATSLSKGMNLLDSVRRANLAAGIAVSKFGTYAVTQEDLLTL